MNRETQLKIGLPETRPRLAKIQRFFRRVDASQLDAEHVPFWKNQTIVYTLVSSLGINIGLLVFGLINFDRLPPEVRFIYDAPSQQALQMDKQLVVYSPILILIFELVIIRLLLNVYGVDRRLANTIGWLVILNNLILLIGGIQIYSLSL